MRKTLGENKEKYQRPPSYGKAKVNIRWPLISLCIFPVVFLSTPGKSSFHLTNDYLLYLCFLLKKQKKTGKAKESLER
jgi:hypothetical protein